MWACRQHRNLGASSGSTAHIRFMCFTADPSLCVLSNFRRCASQRHYRLLSRELICMSSLPGRVRTARVLRRPCPRARTLLVVSGGTLHVCGARGLAPDANNGDSERARAWAVPCLPSSRPPPDWADARQIESRRTESSAYRARALQLLIIIYSVLLAQARALRILSGEAVTASLEFHSSAPRCRVWGDTVPSVAVPRPESIRPAPRRLQIVEAHPRSEAVRGP